MNICCFKYFRFNSQRFCMRTNITQCRGCTFFHYITEISWLHDRNYFLPHRGIAAALAMLAVVAARAIGGAKRQLAIPASQAPSSSS